MRVEDLLGEDPGDVARHLADAAHSAGADAWMRRLATELDRLSERDAFTRWLDVWGISDAEAGRLFGVSRQAIAKWRAKGVPEERLTTVGDLAAITDLLTSYVRRDRIRVVVRRPAEVLGGRSMIDLVGAGRTAELLAVTRHMFDLRRLDAA